MLLRPFGTPHTLLASIVGSGEEGQRIIARSDTNALLKSIEFTFESVCYSSANLEGLT